MPDRRTLEERLRDSQEYHRRLVEAAAAPLLVVDGRLGITDVNEQAVALTGVPRRELIGTPIEDRFSMASPAMEAVRRAVQTGEPSQFAAVLKPSLGEERAVSVSATGFVDPLGDRRGLLLVGPS
jgi:PAS domain S-box-containing protein